MAVVILTMMNPNTHINGITLNGDVIMHRFIYSGLIFLFVAASAYAQSGDSLNLAEAERLALANEPGIAAAQSRARSMAEKSVSAGAFPDPQIRLGVMNLPVGSYDFNQEPMTQKQIGIQQMFPPAGSRKAMRRQLSYQGNAFDQAAATRNLQVLRDVRNAWLETYYWQQAQRTIMENRDLFSSLISVTRSLYSVGRQNQQDMVRAELEFSRLDDRLIQIDEQIHRSRAVLAQWIGLEAHRPLTDHLPNWQGYDDLDELKTRLAKHPMLQSANAMVASADAGVDLARSKYKPMFGIDISYGQREDDPAGNPRDDFISAMLMVSVPLFTGNRQNREVRAAIHNQSANQSDRDALLRDLTRQLGETFARWQQLQFRIDLYDESITGQSRLQAQATLQAYQSDTSDFNDVMRAYITDLNTQLEFIRLQTDRAKVYAQLDYLAGQAIEDNNND
jgi:outer membrane protein TolC